MKSASTSLPRAGKVRAGPGAADLCQRSRNRGHDHPHAVRVLARASLNIIWHCWQTGEAYDPERHVALRRPRCRCLYGPRGTSGGQRQSTSQPSCCLPEPDRP